MPPSSVQTILVIDLDAEFRKWVVKNLKAKTVSIEEEADPAAAVAVYGKLKPDLVLVGPRLGKISPLEVLKELRYEDPEATVLLSTGFPSTNAVIEAMRLGAHDFIAAERLTFELRAVVEKALAEREQIRDTTSNATPDALDEIHLNDAIIGRSAPMQAVFKMIGRVSRTEAPVLVTGESGSGKELVAAAIHDFSPRKGSEFVAINCAAIPENLLESELFGHEKGAFTGAVSKRPGRFEQCDRGTLFLDEIGDMPGPTQSKILRVLQDGTFSRIGSNDTLQTDVRIVAATNRDLEKDVAAGTFREDLFYRLNVVRIHLPPLRERKDDVPLLAEFFLRRISEKTKRPQLKLADATVEALQKYDWPGNVRELENTLQRATALANAEVLLPGDIPLGPGSGRSAARAQKEPESLQAAYSLLLDQADFSLANVQAGLAELALERSEGDAKAAAKLLGLSAAAFAKLLPKG